MQESESESAESEESEDEVSRDPIVSDHSFEYPEPYQNPHRNNETRIPRGRNIVNVESELVSRNSYEDDEGIRNRRPTGHNGNNGRVRDIPAMREVASSKRSSVLNQVPLRTSSSRNQVTNNFTKADAKRSSGDRIKVRSGRTRPFGMAPREKDILTNITGIKIFAYLIDFISTTPIWPILLVLALLVLVQVERSNNFLRFLHFKNACFNPSNGELAEARRINITIPVLTQPCLECPDGGTCDVYGKLTCDKGLIRKGNACISSGERQGFIEGIAAELHSRYLYHLGEFD